MNRTLFFPICALSVALALSLLACQSKPESAATQAPAVAPVATPSVPANPPSTPVGPDSAALVQQFVPAGYRLLDMETGDLNRDAYPDKLLVLDSVQTDTTGVLGSAALRPLLVLTSNAQGQYTLAARNDNAAMCSGCGGMMGDPYQGLTIKNGYFSVEHYGGSAWRWTHIVTFKYNPTDHHWYLHREGGDSFHAADPDKVETHVKTIRDFGRVRFEQYTGDEAAEK
ncbi:hypothetical protein [Hymenobacter sp. DG01]|uniref:hypothetical protein n=1 Tax=Hymenobacter sp. DG01 TaxID=2584940 RepID=UPI0011231339|nr:hypothetical protein [Hymenobacter sp. DG01]